MVMHVSHNRSVQPVCSTCSEFDATSRQFEIIFKTVRTAVSTTGVVIKVGVLGVPLISDAIEDRELKAWLKRPSTQREGRSPQCFSKCK